MSANMLVGSSTSGSPLCSIHICSNVRIALASVRHETFNQKIFGRVCKRWECVCLNLNKNDKKNLHREPKQTYTSGSGTGTSSIGDRHSLFVCKCISIKSKQSIRPIDSSPIDKRTEQQQPQEQKKNSNHGSPGWSHHASKRYMETRCSTKPLHRCNVTYFLDIKIIVI